MQKVKTATSMSSRRTLMLAIASALALGITEHVSAQAASINLATINGANGFRIDGVALNDTSGFPAKAAGDLNGDGIGDLVIGAIGTDINGSNSGSSYVVFGKNTPFDTTLALSSLNGANGFRLDGVTFGESASRSVSAAGDINGDGLDDLIIGADQRDSNAANSGSSYVVFGKNTPFAATLALSSLTGANGFRLDGELESDLSGIAVSAAGDVNGDGLDDLIVGSSRNACVLFGNTAQFAATLALSTLNGANGFCLDGAFAQSVSAADINGDGVTDLILGAPSASPSGSSFVVFGKTTPFAASLSLSLLNGSNGFRIQGEAANDRFGYSVSSAGDINDDGIDDLIVGALLADPNGSATGSSYVVFGQNTPFAASLAVSSLDGSNGFRLDGAASGDFSGTSVSAAGDFNGDGIDDLMVGADGADVGGSYTGSTYVVFGSRTPFDATMALAGLNGRNGFRLTGVAANDRSGCSVSAAGDINGDGGDDLILGAYHADPNGGNSGSSYVLFGREASVFSNGFE